MNIAKAIKVAVRFALKTKDSTLPLGYVRFVPGHAGIGETDVVEEPPRLVAMNNRCGVVVDLDDDVPNTAIPAELLRKVAKEAKAAVMVRPTGYGGVEILATGARWNVPPEDVLPPDRYPGIPIVPNHWTPIDDVAIRRVVHAAAKPKARPELATLNFRPGCVEATDKARLARAALAGGWSGLLPVEMFQQLGAKEDLETCFVPTGAFFRLGDEVRFARFVVLPYPDCAAMIPPLHRGGEAIVSVDLLARAAKQAADVSETGSVVVAFTEGRITLNSWKYEDDPDRFEAVIAASTRGEGSLLVNGLNLAQALKEIPTPRARLQFARPVDPLRLECGGYVECLWPMLA